MAYTAKQAIARVKIEDQIVDLLIKSNVENVYLEDGTTTLASKLADMMVSINAKADATAVTQEINAAIAALIDDAPETYDTLREIAEYIAHDKSAMEALNAAIGNKVDKEEGKGLSANDFTDILKAKLDSIAEGAEVNQNAFSSVKVGDAVIAATDKTDYINLVPGEHVTLTPDAEGKSVTIGVDLPKIDIDAELSDASENPVQNKVVKAAIDAKPDVYIQETEPANMKTNDIWIQLIPESN